MNNLNKPKLVQTEKRQTNRAKAPLSIALFRFNSHNNRELGDVNRLVELIQNSMRETDLVGYINHDLIGLVLPNTNEEGMRKCMKKIFCEHTNLPFSIITGTYPDRVLNHFMMENRESPDFFPLFLEDSTKSEQFSYLRSAWNSLQALSFSTNHDGSHDSNPTTQQPWFDAGSPSIDLLPKSYFLKQLRHEKRRADRIKTPLSIALFHFKSVKDGAPDQIKKLLRLLQGNMRETDVIGCLDMHLVGLLLPDTDEEGARQCVKKIIGEYKTPPFSIIIGTYPDQIFNNLLADDKPATDFYPLFIEDAVQSNRFGYLLKRLLDIVGSLIGILLFSPIMLITMIAIKSTSPGPVIFKQIRLGRRGVPFVFYKFRSMFINTDDRIHREYVAHLIKGHLEEINQGDQDKPLYKIKSDPRVTRVGQIIRKTSIDELPQLFNVLKGDMSLVGPRPPLPYEVEKYQSWHLRRVLDAKPGITGLWQVTGRSQTSFDDMVRLDLQYIRNWSLWLDFKILLKTVKVVLKLAGAV